MAYQENLERNLEKLEECEHPQQMKLKFQAYYKMKHEHERNQMENRYRFRVQTTANKPIADDLNRWETSQYNQSSNTPLDQSRYDAKRVTFNLSNSVLSNHGTKMNPTLDQMTTFSHINDVGN